MIDRFEHKGLKVLFTKGVVRAIRANHSVRLGDQLTALHSAISLADMNIPGWKLHQIKAPTNNHWAVEVSEGWRIVFKLEAGNACVVSYEDIH